MFSLYEDLKQKNESIQIDLDKVISKIKNSGQTCHHPMSDDQVLTAEQTFGVKFPKPMKYALNVGLPSKCYNWGDLSNKNIDKINEALGWPLEGLIFDVEFNNFWLDTWGKKPSSLEDAINITKEQFLKVPKLIPIFSHRYIPQEPDDWYLPIFSVYQTDIIYYGANICLYLSTEFAHLEYEQAIEDVQLHIPFWSCFCQ